MVKRLTILVLLLCILATTGCAGLIGTPEPVMLTFMVPDYFDQGQYDALAQQFQEQYPYITVDIKNRDGYEASDLEGVDVLLTEQQAARYLVDAGAVMDLSTLLSESEDVALDEFYTGIVDMFRFEGKPYGLPIAVDLLVMYYNRDLFDANLVDYPANDWTWQDFLETGLAITDPEQEVFGYAIGHQDYFGMLEPMIWIHQHGGQMFDNWMAPQTIILDTETNIEAMEFYASLIHEYHIAPTWEEGPRLRPSSYPWSRILQGNYGMWMGSLSERGGMSWPEEWEFNWGVAPLPHDEVPFNLATVVGVMVSQSTAHPEEAWLWAQFLSQQYPQGLMPARRTLAESSTIDTTFGADVAVVARIAMEEAAFLNPDMSAIESQFALLVAPFDAIRKGTADPATALAEGQRALEE